MNWLVTIQTMVSNGSLQWTLFSFTRMCFPLTMTFEGLNNNILTPFCAYKQRSVVSLACVPPSRTRVQSKLLDWICLRARWSIIIYTRARCCQYFPWERQSTAQGRRCHFFCSLFKQIVRGKWIVVKWIELYFLHNRSFNSVDFRRRLNKCIELMTSLDFK